MTRTIILCTVLVLLSFKNSDAQRFEGGILAGFNASQVDGDTYAGYDKFGIALGAYTATQINDKISAELQIKFMQKGASKKVTNASPSIYISRLNYIEIPVLLRYRVNPKLLLYAGPGFGYLFKYSEEDENGKLAAAEAIKFKSFELSGNAGFRYTFYKKLSVSILYSYSITPVANHPSNQTYYLNRGSYNNLFTTFLSYQF